MPVELLSESTLLGFLLTLIRVSGVFAFVPVPGLKSVVDPARVVLILAVTVALFPVWPHPAYGMQAGQVAAWLGSEAALGVGIGLTVAFTFEAFLVAAQLISLPAGFSFASTIDPSTQADSTVLGIFAQTTAALLFFASGLDREVLRIFARSLETVPAGTFVITRSIEQTVITASSSMFSIGFRLALPVIAVLLMTDISISLLGRVNSQLQLMSIAFPVKMVVGLCIFAWLTTLMPALMRGGSSIGFSAARTLLGH
jgi:flagellar biosynthetic protein FliR